MHNCCSSPGLNLTTRTHPRTKQTKQQTRRTKIQKRRVEIFYVKKDADSNPVVLVRGVISSVGFRPLLRENRDFMFFKKRWIFSENITTSTNYRS